MRDLREASEKRSCDPDDRIIESDGRFAVHEVFYRENGSISSWTEEPVFPPGDSREELR